MKITIQKNKSSPLCTVEIPSTLSLNSLAPGEMFEVFLVRNKNVREKITACFLADKRSLLVGNEIVRISKKWNYLANVLRPVEPKHSARKGVSGNVLSPMTGKVISILVEPGAQVKKGDTLLVIEAMKMENRILAQGDAVVKSLKVTQGQSVTGGEPLVTLGAVDTP